MHRRFEDAVRRGLANASEAGHLGFLGLIEHAKHCGTKNRPGLLRSLVERQHWHFITQRDEEQAVGDRLKWICHGETFGERAERAASPEPSVELSTAARLVQTFGPGLGRGGVVGSAVL